MEPLALLNENFQIIEFNNAFVNSFEFEQHPLSINLRDLFKYEFDFDAISKKSSKMVLFVDSNQR